MRYLRLSILAVSLALLASCAKPPRVPKETVPEETAAATSPEARIQHVPPADPQKYAGMRDMKAWRNPYLIVRVDGVGVLDVGNNEQQIVDPDKLSEALAKLPGSAWPYGRVVAIQEISAASSEEDKAKLRKNRALVAGALESMQVLINWVPSA
ncbi:MAG TPA: hypothetical protein VN948_16190 [Terriglobales bacterium]|nr:hypothetical protein [Terriglobales bacterium]